MSSNKGENKRIEFEELKKKNLDIITQYNQAKKKYSLFLKKLLK